MHSFSSITRIAVVAVIFFGLSASRLSAQERIFGAAISEADSYARGAFIDQQYAEIPAWSALPYGPFAPWRVFGGYPFGPGPWGWRNAFLAPRYAPFAYTNSPYYAWPYEWSYEPVPHDARPFGLLPEPHDGLMRPARPLGPRRLYW